MAALTRVSSSIRLLRLIPALHPPHVPVAIFPAILKKGNLEIMSERFDKDSKIVSVNSTFHPRLEVSGTCGRAISRAAGR